MILPKLAIITACSRPANLPIVSESLKQLDSFFDWQWIIVLDEAKASSNSVGVKPHKLEVAPSDGEGIAQKNRGIELASHDTWIYFLDDDNIIHPDFGIIASRTIVDHYSDINAKVFVFKQQMADGSHRLDAGPVKYGKIDTASFLVHSSVIGRSRFSHYSQGRADDYMFINSLYTCNQHNFRFINKYACYHNGLNESHLFITLKYAINKFNPMTTATSEIYVYWEGSQRHWYYNLCLKSIIQHNPRTIVLSRADVEDILGPIPRELDGIYVTHRVDWIRKAFIAAVGGMWLDMDFICFRSLEGLAQLATSNFDFVGFKEWGGNWMDNFFVASKGSKLLHTAADYALAQARLHGKNLPWLAMASDAIGYAFRRNEWCNWMEIPTHLISPHTVNDPHWFTKQPDTQDDIGPFRSFGFMTSFHTLRGWLNSQSENEFLNGNSRLLAIFRRALA